MVVSWWDQRDMHLMWTPLLIRDSYRSSLLSWPDQNPNMCPFVIMTCQFRFWYCGIFRGSPSCRLKIWIAGCQLSTIMAGHMYHDAPMCSRASLHRKIHFHYLLYTWARVACLTIFGISHPRSSGVLFGSRVPPQISQMGSMDLEASHEVYAIVNPWTCV